MQDRTLALLRRGLADPGVTAGIFASSSTFLPWDGPPDAIADRVRLAWDALGREPDVGEIAWLTLRERVA